MSETKFHTIFKELKSISIKYENEMQFQLFIS
jgi:hypothetical protein